MKDYLMGFLFQPPNYYQWITWWNISLIKLPVRIIIFKSTIFRFIGGFIEILFNCHIFDAFIIVVKWPKHYMKNRVMPESLFMPINLK